MTVLDHYPSIIIVAEVGFEWPGSISLPIIPMWFLSTRVVAPTKTMDRSTMFHGKIHHKYGDFPIVMLNFQGVQMIIPTINGLSCHIFWVTHGHFKPVIPHGPIIQPLGQERRNAQRQLAASGTDGFIFWETGTCAKLQIGNRMWFCCSFFLNVGTTIINHPQIMKNRW